MIPKGTVINVTNWERALDIEQKDLKMYPTDADRVSLYIPDKTPEQTLEVFKKIDTQLEL